jgi:uncharacterized membrane protein YoaK (UPF0700 family)
MLAICLTTTAGYVDGYGLLVLGTYVSFMSGNTTMTGVSVGQGNLAVSLSPAIAVLSFVAGSFAANLITHSLLRYAHCVLFGFTTALLVISFGIGHDGMSKTENIALLSLGMGIVNAALSQIGAETISLTFMTGTLSRIGSHLALAFKERLLLNIAGALRDNLCARAGAKHLTGCFRSVWRSNEHQ